MTLSNEAIKESLEKQREELVNEVRTLENNLLVAKEKFLKVQGAIEILEIVMNPEAAADAKVKQAEVVKE